ncbi:MAG TPA: DUF4180 domain-containing protein [Acidimicrobiia bacterium]|nr:DUF4180 domain-containing protein [Acidimicrobiia bacterium]
MTFVFRWGIVETEGEPGTWDPTLSIEACLSHQTDALLLRADDLPEEFFDLSSGVAGEVLQRFANYRIRLAVIAGPERFSSRFADLLFEERGRGRFAIFDDPDAARVWLLGSPSPASA